MNEPQVVTDMPVSIVVPETMRGVPATKSRGGVRVAAGVQRYQPGTGSG